MNKRKVYDLSGKDKGSVDLPEVFSKSVRSDLMQRALLAAQANKRQSYGSDKKAGTRTSARFIGNRHARNTMQNREMARMPRILGAGPLNYTAALVPQSKGGRRAHPPKPGKDWSQKINKKERQIALNSAYASLSKDDLLKERHSTEVEAPIVVVDDIESTKKTKDLEKLIESLGLEEELKRGKKKKVRAGKGTMRGRVYKRKRGLLFVINENKGIVKAASNLAGVDVVNVNSPDIEKLVPGGKPRISIWSKSAVEALENK